MRKLKKVYIGGAKRKQINNDKIITELIEIFGISKNIIKNDDRGFIVPSFVDTYSKGFKNFMRRHKAKIDVIATGTEIPFTTWYVIKPTQ